MWEALATRVARRRIEIVRVYGPYLTALEAEPLLVANRCGLSAAQLSGPATLQLDS
jgi:hypothetical protein